MRACARKWVRKLRRSLTRTTEEDKTESQMTASRQNGGAGVGS